MRLSRGCQKILTEYLVPDGIDGADAINQLIAKLDGTEYRAIQLQSQ